MVYRRPVHAKNRMNIQIGIKKSNLNEGAVFNRSVWI